MTMTSIPIDVAATFSTLAIEETWDVCIEKCLELVESQDPRTFDGTWAMRDHIANEIRKLKLRSDKEAMIQ